MFRNRMQISTLLLVLCFGVSILAGQSTPTTANAVVPTLASFSGVLTDLNGKPLTGVTGVTFSLYKDADGGAPLWMEVQNVRPNKAGHYTLTLGSTTSEGLPTNLFASGEARWLGVQPEGQLEQPRVLLLSVPYALKAADAETVGGLPPSAFMLAPPSSASSAISSTRSSATTTAFSATGTGKLTGVTAGTDLTGGGTSGNVTLNLDTTKVPELAAPANNFVGNLNVGGALGVGTTSPGDAQLAAIGTVAGDVAIYGQGFGGPGAGAGEIGEPNPNNGLAGSGVIGWGGGGPVNVGAPGLVGLGGGGLDFDSSGGVFQGGSGSRNGSGDGLDAYTGSGLAGFFEGNVDVEGNLSKSSGSFKIDHPLDPADKYLYHSFVESPDMMNIYNGNVLTDSSGDATIPLPEWFETLNRDFRYQLTVIGQFAQAIVNGEVANHQFSIKTDKPGVKVSWQVTGIRHDAWANAHRIPVEEQKNARERGHYIHPELYGAPEETGIGWARHPEMMKHMKEMRRQGMPPASTARVANRAVSVKR
ncbi:MAG: hypothetical protein LAO23_16120 [Acidobacteriia bacterium]|nr:hypothetical protein [Terriglobia bacterium]